MEQQRPGLIHIYCGDGKGKTTASLGLSIRAAGTGMKVFIVQFLKNQDTGELESLSQIPNIEVLRGKEGNVFSFRMTDEQKAKSKEIHDHNLRHAMEIAFAGQCDLLVLDEVIGAYNRGLVDHDLLQQLIDNKPTTLELVLTGRNPEQWLVERADYVSEIQKIKHPYDQGIGARKGIEK